MARTSLTLADLQPGQVVQTDPQRGAAQVSVS
jgi:hypothetical protein